MSDTPERVRVTKKFNFDMAHALHGHDGPCRNIHGHSYQLFVTLRGTALRKDNHPKDGMIIDFSDLKSKIEKAVVKEFDHALVLSQLSYSENIEIMKKQYEKIILVPFQPSCENLILEFKRRITLAFEGSNFEIFSLRLDETSTSYAEWFLEDNN